MANKGVTGLVKCDLNSSGTLWVVMNSAWGQMYFTCNSQLSFLKSQFSVAFAIPVVT